MFPGSFRRAHLQVSDQFLEQVVPSIVKSTPTLADEEITPETSPAELLKLYLFINGTLREQNRQTLAAFSGGTGPTMQWEGAFVPLANAQVESRFADHRTYIYDGQEVDQQIHLGFDLASTANASVLASNNGNVLHADYLGIYGNSIIIDHGMGIQSLYAHLSRIDVFPGQIVERGQLIGRSGSTGLAGGDHLHFAILLNGHPVNPTEWWDPNWIRDRILRKLVELTPTTSP